MKTTICALLYGDFPQLAARLLESLKHQAIADVPIRLGLNEVSPQTLQIVDSFTATQTDRRVDKFHSPVNRFKYPMMRWMLRGDSSPVGPIETDNVMWFDDDSWLKHTAPNDWLLDVQREMTKYEMIGSIWHKAIDKEQIEFFRKQPWHVTDRIYNPHSVRFITGGWWTIKTHILFKHDWPPPDMSHNGGDVALGELFRQQDYRLGKYITALGINADDTGKCSTAKRRGESQPAYGSRGWDRLKNAQLPDD